jgi:hypothetical protein
MRGILPHYHRSFVELPKALISDSHGKLSFVNFAYIIALLRAADEISWTKIVQHFGSSTRRIKGLIAGLFGL